MPDMSLMRYTFLAGALVSCTPALNACSCEGDETVAHALEWADAVFVGKVISEETLHVSRLDGEAFFPHYVKRYAVEIERPFKNGRLRTGDTVIIYTGMGHGDCGFHFERGGRYVIYGADSDYDAGRLSADRSLIGRGIYWTNICTRTRAFEEQEVRQLTQLE